MGKQATIATADRPGCRRALTLVELLVTMTIIALLMSILTTTLMRVRGTTRSFMCKNNLRTVVGKFALFADEYSHPLRGEHSDELGPNRFLLESFRQSLYQVGDFFFGDPDIVRQVGNIPYAPSEQPMICPAGPQNLYRLAEVSTVRVGPQKDVSTAFNMRLHKGSFQLTASKWGMSEVPLSSDVLNHTWVPLVFDVDGRRIKDLHCSPFYAAPDVGDGAWHFVDDKLWFPSMRHGGLMHAGFIGGHVQSSRDPANEPGWDWAYQPPPEQ